ncbi:MAG TPA: DUF2062 domain-containing protein [Terracidiphilus sp.]|nr:DUF2062 domain-containing protein [Terracidiphilus sp.]
MMTRGWLELRREQAAGWLRQGCSPRRLALTLALGFAIGCIPMVGIPTALCLILACTLRLNQGAIQAANYLAMPLQVALMLPLVRMGHWMFPGSTQAGLPLDSSGHMLTQLCVMTGQAMSAWLVIAGPGVLLMTACLTPVLRRIPALDRVRAAE